MVVRRGTIAFLLVMLSLNTLIGCATEQTAGESNLSDSEFSDSTKSGDSAAAADTGSEEKIEKDIQKDGFSLEEPPAAEQPKEAEKKATPPPPVVEEPRPVPTPEPAEPQVAKASPENKKIIKIQRLQFRANDSGGTLAIEADAPITYTTRANSATNQLVIEIPNARLTKKANRSLVTKDFPGGIGAVDPYQAPGSDTARVVLQMRDGAPAPVMETEGNALLVISASRQAKSNEVAEANVAAPEKTVKSGEIVAESDSKVSAPEKENIAEGNLPPEILSTGSLEEFLAGTQKFYGKKISFEANDVEIRDIFKFLSEESGVNLIISEEVRGKISVRFKQVPWDQVLVVLLQSKKLGYVRQGQILRISRLAEIKQDEEDFSKAAKAKKAMLPLKVKLIPISYAKVEDIARQIKDFLSERGKVIEEKRTSAVVISDIEEGIARAEKLIASLDTPPMQVLIEGKIVEARDTFSRFVGLNWSSQGTDIELGRNSKGTSITGNMGVFSNQVPQANMFWNPTIRSLDILGDLNATLGLGESTGEVKVLSSPRILTLNNEKAEINQSSEAVSIQTTTDTTGKTSTNVKKDPVTLKLSVNPQITNDASVILDVDVSRAFAGEIVDKQSQARPVNTRTAKTKVIVRNGQTAVIGGIYQSDTTDGENRIPLLADIPILGWLFKGHQSDRQKNELLIFLTPKIVGQADTGSSGATPLAPKVNEGVDEGFDL